MLDTLDILVGFTLVMLIMSMAVTMLTQLIGSAMLNLRGQALRLGVSRLLALLDRGLKTAEAHQIADHILRNPLVGQPSLFSANHRVASVVHREELIKLILDFATADDAERASADQPPGLAELRERIRRSLGENGIDDPKAVLTRIRNGVLELERTSPHLSHSARLNTAILTFADSEFLSKINSWFDQTIDRVADVFTSRTRMVTAGLAVLVALVLHLDAISLINRLSVDDELRTQLVSAAIERVQRDGSATPAAAGDVPAETKDDALSGEANLALPAEAPPQAEPGAREQLDAIRAAGLGDLENYGLVALPRSFDDWAARWKIAAPDGSEEWSIVMRLFGILLSAALLSLGAPFWFSTLRNLVKLRSVIARRDDEQRAERQSSQPPPAGAGAGAVPPQYRGGEAGDLEPAG